MDAAASPRISFGTSAGELFIRFEGTATNRVCPSAEQLVAAYLSTHHDSPRVVIDVQDCRWVDSTFAGWLVGLLRRTRAGGGKLTIAHCGEECHKNFGTMGLTKLLEFGEVAAPRELRQMVCPELVRNDPQALRLLLAAHEELAELDEANRKVFGPIVAMLRNECEKKGLPAQ
ncbi:hypothetical protein RAS1_40700 [Phycisphaerae bacterium RAS1]|nr:hypothetical protein RAS1_40700 [Phycisphaerae bacterium RAS1]